MDESKDPAPSVSTELRPTLSPCAGGNHDDREDSNHGDQRPELGSLQIVVVVKEEEEDWDCYDTGGDPSLLADMEATLSPSNAADRPLDNRRKAGRPPRCLDQRGEKEAHDLPASQTDETQNLPTTQKPPISLRVDKHLLCPECGKTYPREYDLKIHLRTHTGERPYQCDECGKTFVRKQGLRQHRRSHAPKPMGPTRQLGRPPSMGSAGKRTNPSAHRIGRTKQKNH
ncbi:endothelial zinc finger protein induced by tumor necrosis factor alpha-like isoform X3 [Esox lucius]|uniref:endothelial zinc finger protein induced by tumor necrosis factor alpha-like isoform X3 n=1 Tax=Esox lucius TaxID=8010 RepID=UPI000661F06B|nr:endothelial zinc finger protein induced by tumor necrosis factor alpha-like isoform X3 [Esox lucius]